ncbi:hypothetical protein EUX98_g9386, partial [Antrodiella citrinella]
MGKKPVKGKGKVDTKAETAPSAGAPDPRPQAALVDYLSAPADTDAPLPIPPPVSPRRSDQGQQGNDGWGNEHEVAERGHDDWGDGGGGSTAGKDYREEEGSLHGWSADRMRWRGKEEDIDWEEESMYAHFSETSPEGRQPPDLEDSGNDGGHSHGHDNDDDGWGAHDNEGGGSAQMQSPSQPPPAPPPQISAQDSADDWQNARVTVTQKGFSRASGKPPTPPPNTMRTEGSTLPGPAAAHLAQMAQMQQRASQAAAARQQQQQQRGMPMPPYHSQPARVPMPQPQPYGLGGPVNIPGHTSSRGGGGFMGMPQPNPNPAATSRGGPPSMRSMSLPVPGASNPNPPKKSDTDAFVGWRTWANEAAMGSKVATAIAANIPQRQQSDILAALYARAGGQGQ